MHDVIVVGAGPAGAATALGLLRRDPSMDVVLLERLPEGRFERYHRMCGACVSRGTLGRFGGATSGRVLNRIGAAEEQWPEGITIHTRAKGLIVDRPALIKDLIDRFESYGGTLTRASVDGVTMEDDRYLISTSDDDLHSRYVVGADGAHSRVRRELFDEGPEERIAVRQYILPERTADTMRFVYGERYQGGYGWRFPVGERTSIGFPKGSGPAPSGAVEVHGRYIPIGPLANVVEGNALLVGDAASQVNPITFGGIRVSFEAARRAARAIIDGRPDRYQRWWSRCPENDPVYMEAYRSLKVMDDGRMADLVRPFEDGYGAVAYLRAWLRRPQDRTVNRAFRLSQRYGW